MKIWKLSVIDSGSSDWRASTYKGDVIVRAKDMRSARMEATKSFAIAAERKLGENTTICPWGQSDLVACESIESESFDPDGEQGILSPE